MSSAAVTPGDNMCQFKYTVNVNNDSQRIAAVASEPGGALRVHPSHVLLSAVGRLLPGAHRATNIVTMHLIEFLIMEEVILGEDLENEPPSWHITSNRLESPDCSLNCLMQEQFLGDSTRTKNCVSLFKVA